MIAVPVTPTNERVHAAEIAAAKVAAATEMLATKVPAAVRFRECRAAAERHQRKSADT
jgi:hypothetical protein